jgi:RNA polymerase sigma factor (sigma-70 family)
MSRQFAAVTQWIRHLAALDRPVATSDQQLLDRFIAHQDAEAFAGLVSRHGPMVWAVCRRVLSDPHDAEDAFQATFLVLVRKASAIAIRSSIGSWLHGVAYRVACKARTQRIQRRSRESEFTDMPVAEPTPDRLWDDVRAVLDEEVSRLPEKYRAPFVLCYLEGKTNEEASQHLRCPKGTVATRLAWAREVLRKRLGRRGVTLSTAALGTLLSERALPAAAPGAIVSNTIHAAMLFAAGNATASSLRASVTALVHDGVRTVATSKLKMMLAACVAVAALSTSAGILAYQGTLAHSPEDKSAAPDREQPAQQRSAEEGTIMGVVVDAEGRPLSDVEIRAYRNGLHPEKSFRSDKQGRIEIPKKWDDRDDHYTLIVQLRDRLGWYSLPDYSAGNQGKPVNSFRIRVLPRTKQIHGVLLHSDGRPLSGAPVKIHDLDGARYYRTAGKNPLGEAVTDARGRFSIRVPEYLQCELIPIDPSVIRKRLIAKAGQPDLGAVKVATAGAITGRVTGARSGQPVAGASVGAQFLSFPDYESGGWAEGETDTDGRYMIPSLRPGIYNVLFERVPDNPKMAAAAQEAVRVEVGKKTTVDFRSAEGRLVSGKVIGKDDNKPIPNCHVGYYGAARSRSGAACLMVRTDAAGKFQFSVPPGTAYLYVAESRGPVMPDSSRTLEVPAEKDPEEVTLLSYSKIQKDGQLGETFITTGAAAEKEDHSYQLPLRLRSNTGKPVVGANVWLWRKGATTWSQWSGVEGEDRYIPVGSSGEGQTYFLIIEAEGWARPKPPEFVVSKVMKPLVVDMTPATYVPVRGQVTDPDGKPIAGALVRAGLVLSHESTQFPWGVEPSTDAEGRFELKQLRPDDKFNLEIRKEGYETLKTKFLVVERPAAFDVGTLSLLPAGQLPAVVGKPAPGFAVTKWIGKNVPSHAAFAPEDFRGKIVVLAFLDEARPSQRLLSELDSVHEKWASKGVVIIRVYETGREAELGKLSPTSAVLAGAGVLSEGASRAAEVFGVKARPTVALVDANGVLRDADVPSGHLQERIEKLLQSRPAGR